MAGQAKALFDTLKKSFEEKPCDTAKCEEQLTQLKLAVFSSASAATPAGGEIQELARDMLELACFLSIRREEMAAFERHVAQLKMYQNGLKPSDKTHQILGLWLLFLLSQDRIGEFHTELELIPFDIHENEYIKQPIQLERNIMEGNYSKILEAKDKMPQEYYHTIMGKLADTVRTKIGASLERSYESLPANEAAKMLILPDIGKLREFVQEENERKQKLSEDDTMGDVTPSLSRRNLTVAVSKWEFKGERVFFTRDVEKRAEIWEDLMINTIGYATDLERIV